MNHIITEDVTVTYSVDVPGEIIGYFAGQAASQAANNSEQEEIYDALLEAYILENQPPRKKWRENVRERIIEVSDSSEEPGDITDTMRLDFIEKFLRHAWGKTGQAWVAGYAEGFKTLREEVDNLIKTKK